MAILYPHKIKCEVGYDKKGSGGVGVKHDVHILSLYWIYDCGNIQDIHLVLEIVDDCGCVHIKCMYLFPYINGRVGHNTDSIYP